MALITSECAPSRTRPASSSAHTAPQPQMHWRTSFARCVPIVRLSMRLIMMQAWVSRIAFLLPLSLTHSLACPAVFGAGFYYMSNAAGRLIGTLSSGLIYSAGAVEGEHFAWWVQNTVYYTSSARISLLSAVRRALAQCRAHSAAASAASGSNAAHSSGSLSSAPAVVIGPPALPHHTPLPLPLRQLNGPLAHRCFWAASLSVLVLVVSSLPLQDGGRLNCGKCVGCCEPEEEPREEPREEPEQNP